MTIIERINHARGLCVESTGVMPNRLTMPTRDYRELERWLASHTEPLYQCFVIIPPTICGMRFKHDVSAQTMRAYFQES